MSLTTIKAENIGKLYRLGEVGTGTISHDLNRWWARLRGKEDPFAKVGQLNDRTKKADSDYVWALQHIDFSANEGEVVGIIGKNGAGKSTLLKILSKVTKPTEGSIKLRGRIASLLEVGTGFHPELTGRENIFLNGALLGMTKPEIRAKFDSIVEFSGVERYIDTPVKRYSSGMYVRLAFAVAAHLDTEILIVDEVLAVGDAEFQKKCLGKMDEVAHSNGKTILFVSHDINAIEQLCNTGLLLENGTVKTQGPIKDVIANYIHQKADVVRYEAKGKKNASAFFQRIWLSDRQGTPCNEFNFDEPVFVNMDIIQNGPAFQFIMMVEVIDQKKRKVFACESTSINTTMRLELEPQMLVRGKYSLHCFIDIYGLERLDDVDDVCNFTIVDKTSPMVKHGEYDYGNVFGRYTWHQQ